MFLQSREDVRETFCSIYQKMQQKLPLHPLESQIAAVIMSHPEFHHYLQRAEDAQALEFTPEQGQTNPFLHMGMHIAIREQINTNRPAGIRDCYNALASRHGESEAEHRIMECLGEALWTAQRNLQEPDEHHYLKCIRELL